MVLDMIQSGTTRSQQLLAEPAPAPAAAPAQAAAEAAAEATMEPAVKPPEPAASTTTAAPPPAEAAAAEPMVHNVSQVKAMSNHNVIHKLMENLKKVEYTVYLQKSWTHAFGK